MLILSHGNMVDKKEMVIYRDDYKENNDLYKSFKNFLSL